jgi:hypothetical protein
MWNMARALLCVVIYYALNRSLPSVVFLVCYEFLRHIMPFLLAQFAALLCWEFSCIPWFYVYIR